MHHVAVGDQIFLAFEPKLSSLARAGFASFPGMLVGILFARIVAEFILMVFRINEHLAAIWKRGGVKGQRDASPLLTRSGRRSHGRSIAPTNL